MEQSSSTTRTAKSPKGTLSQKRLKYRTDLTFRKKRIQAAKDYVTKRISKQPDYLKLLRLRKTIYNIREKIDRHQTAIEILDKELLQKIKEKEELAARLRYSG